MPKLPRPIPGEIWYFNDEVESNLEVYVTGIDVDRGIVYACPAMDGHPVGVSTGWRQHDWFEFHTKEKQ